jgi:hypothetical protein
MEPDAPTPDVVDLSFATGDEGLLRLAKALRLIDGGIWVTPEEFRWDFSIISNAPNCGKPGCALGLADNMWPNDRFICSGNLATRLNPDDKRLRTYDFEKLFAPRTAAFERVTPTMVANVIEDYVTTGRVRWRELHPEAFD